MAMAKKQLWFILPLLVFLVAIGLFYTRLGKDTQIETSQTVNNPLPNFSLPLLADQQKFATNADLPKQPYLLNVWASWCITCKIEHPFLMELAKSGVPIVGVNYKDKTKDALAYLNQHKDPFAVNVVDTGSYGVDLGLTGTPESFVVDSQGNVRQHIIGEVNEKRYKTRVLPCLTALRKNADEQTILRECR